MFTNRTEAGQRLALALMHLQPERPRVLALPRGGVPVGYEIARALGAPLDVFVVRKIGAPSYPEFGVGALAEDGTLLLDPVIERLGIDTETLQGIVARERAEAARRVQKYRGGAPPPDVRGRTVIVVDDGMATGGTARVAIRALRARGAGRLVLGVPIASADALAALRAEADEVVCLHAPQNLGAIGEWYGDFRQVEDEEVQAWLQRAREASSTE